MNTVVPPALAPYLQECLETRSLTLLTSVLDTPANWLVVRLLHLGLQGNKQTPLLAQGTSASTHNHKVILVSVWRSFETWSEIAKRCGLNLVEKIAGKQIHYIDGLSTSATGPDPRSEIVKLKASTLKELNNSIQTAMQATTSSKTTIVIDGLDFLLACDEDVTSTDVQQLITNIQSKVHSVVVTCAADDPLLHNMDASATPIEYEHGAFVRQLAYQARLIFQLRPLETGHSKDVNGTVRVSRGGAWEGGADVLGSRDLDENEWLYNVKGDGSVRVWGRGEA